MTDDLASRFGDFERALAEMQDVVAHLPDRGQAERAIRVDARLTGIGRLVLAGIALLLVLLVLLGAGAWQAHRNARTARAGVVCLLEQFEEHRHANRAAHEAFAVALPAPYHVASEDKPPPIPRALEAACAPFLGGVVGE